MSVELQMFEQYKALCQKRDDAYKAVAPLKEKLEAINAAQDKARQEAAELSKQISDALGNESWLSLKSDIATLAKALGKKDGLLASK